MTNDTEQQHEITTQLNPSLERYTTADAMLDALSENDVSYLFANFGSDHPTIIEALAKGKALNKELPKVVTCPHEILTLSAAHGYAMVSGRAQAVFVHTDVGTSNLGGTIHNAARSRIPVFIFAGETPYTLEDELPGSRRGPINYLQNVYDQRGIVRQYVKWEYELRTGKNVKQIVYRAMQLANSDPKGPIYLTGGREVIEEDVSKLDLTRARWEPIVKNTLPERDVEEIVDALVHATNPLIVTSYIGRNKQAVSQLVEFCETLGIPVLEIAKQYMNFPSENPLHLGYEENSFVANADVIVVLDSDVPWEPKVGKKPSEECKVFYIDIDPIKEDIPIWYMFADRHYRADSEEALRQLNEFVNTLTLNEEKINERKTRYKEIHEQQRIEWKEKESCPEGNVITPSWLASCIREVVNDEDIIINETQTNSGPIYKHIPRNQEGTFFNNGGSSLGWSGGASIGAKLAEPDRMVVCLSGDGAYMLSVPSSVHYIARRYHTPFLTIIFNNQGWNATKINVLALYPDGVAKQDDSLYVNFDKPSDLSKIAEASGDAYAELVDHPLELPRALRRAVEEVRNGRSAVIDVRLPQISNQSE